MEEYPYYIYPDVMALRSGSLDEEEKKRVVRKIAANVGDPASLRIILGIDPEEYAAFYPDMTVETPSTFDTIDTFLDKFAPDSIPDPPGIDDPEKTAYSLIKEKKYEEALEILIDLDLNNPGKNIYFAHQIRFLQKLIALGGKKLKQ